MNRVRPLANLTDGNLAVVRLLDTNLVFMSWTITTSRQRTCPYTPSFMQVYLVID
jgi:hypothetical protein